MEESVPFLREEFIREACADAALPEEVTSALLRRAARTRKGASLRALVHERHDALYLTEPPPLAEIRAWPLLATADDPEANILYALVALSSLPQMRALYAAHAIPDDVYRHTLSDVLRWMEHYREHAAVDRTSGARGSWGLSPRYLPWLRHHFLGELFHLGRLQFEPGPHAGWRGANLGARFFRHRATGNVIALADPDLTFRADGQLQGAGGVTDPAGEWRSSFDMSDTHAIGQPISPLGYAERRTVALPLDAWRLALSPGDPVLNIHMPAGSPMDFDQCGESLRQALDFFPRHFPDRRFEAFACSSWLLDPQLDGPMPPTSNIVRFQRQVYLLPSPSGGGSTLERVFGSADVDLATAPRDTALRRAVLGIVERGGHIRSGRSVIFPEDLRAGAWGAERYRSQPPP